MANITKVEIRKHTNGTMEVFVFYKNSNRYRRDRARMFPHIPQSAEKFIKNASIMEVEPRYYGTFTTYR